MNMTPITNYEMCSKQLAANNSKKIQQSLEYTLPPDIHPLAVNNAK
jgi:hypothetical protein